MRGQSCQHIDLFFLGGLVLSYLLCRGQGVWKKWNSLYYNNISCVNKITFSFEKFYPFIKHPVLPQLLLINCCFLVSLHADQFVFLGGRKCGYYSFFSNITVYLNLPDRSSPNKEKGFDLRVVETTTYKFHLISILIHYLQCERLTWRQCAESSAF